MYIPFIENIFFLYKLACFHVIDKIRAVDLFTMHGERVFFTNLINACFFIMYHAVIKCN